MKFVKHVHVPLRMNHNHFGEPLTQWLRLHGWWKLETLEISPDLCFKSNLYLNMPPVYLRSETCLFTILFTNFYSSFHKATLVSASIDPPLPLFSFPFIWLDIVATLPPSLPLSYSLSSQMPTRPTIWRHLIVLPTMQLWEHSLWERKTVRGRKVQPGGRGTEKHAWKGKKVL